MQVRAQIAMVMNLDKCIGCHTCSVTCKNVWTNRRGTEYVWFNDVETKPGIGYPKQWEDQDRWKGGWELRGGKLRLRAGGRLRKLATLFFNPELPTLDDYYEPWTYDYETLTTAPTSKHQPVARPESQVTGRPLDLQWGPNWEDDLAGAPERARLDPNLKDGVEEHVRLEYEKAFMFYLPRICEHCLNPSCVASCPSGAMYKRAEDGIVLVDQEQCRSWRMCVSGCPYKKVYFNWSTGKAEKCTLCYPRIEAGQPTICSETCVGKIRYLGVVLYDADRVQEAASVEDEKDLLPAQLSLFLDPNDPGVREQARRDGIAEDWLEAASRSPVYALAVRHKVALPLHPEYRTLPMVWYVPPLSPVMSLVEGPGSEADPDDVFPAIEELRIPIEYLANLLTAGDPEPVRVALRRLAAMRSWTRERNLGGEPDRAVAAAVGMEPAEIDAMFRLLAIAKYDERYVIPQTHGEVGLNPHSMQGACGLDFEGGPGSCGAIGKTKDPFGAEPLAAPASGGAGSNVAFLDFREGNVNAKLLSVLLAYPDEALVEALPELRSAAAELPRSERRALEPMLETLASNPLGDLRRAYVDTFDFDRRCGLHLTYHTHGDRRQRGLELVRLKRRYAEAGLPFEGTELPDYLPVMLEFASLRPEEGRELLASFRAPLELVRAALHDRGSLYAGVLDALCEALPHPTARQLAEARRLAEEGPPAELVGLEPFGVPELAEVGA